MIFVISIITMAQDGNVNEDDPPISQQPGTEHTPLNPQCNAGIV